MKPSPIDLSNQYPWHRDMLQQLYEMLVAGRLPHALFFRQRFDYFDEQLLWAMASMVLCDSHSFCKHCQHCHLMTSQTHPNCLHQTAESGQGIDHIRQLMQRIWRAPKFDKPLVVLIEGVDSLSIAAQNALLKNVEEPPENTVFILTAENVANLLPTILSRVQRLTHQAVNQHDVLHWLQQQLVASDEPQASKTEAEIGAIAKLAQFSPKEALALLNEPECVQRIQQDRKRFAQFMQGKCPVDTLLNEQAATDLPEYLLRYQYYVDATIQSLFEKTSRLTDSNPTETLQQQHWQGVSVRRLYDLRDIIERLRQLELTNVNLLMQCRVFFMNWQNNGQ